MSTVFLSGAATTAALNGEEAPYGALALLQLPLMAGFGSLAQWTDGAILFAKAIKR